MGLCESNYGIWKSIFGPLGVSAEFRYKNRASQNSDAFVHGPF